MNRLLGLCVVLGLVLATSPVLAGAAQPTSAALEKLVPVAAELAAGGCQVGADHPGSLHAATIPGTLLEPALATLHLSYVCGDAPVALYLYDFGSAAKVPAQLAFLGARLWGGPGPSAEHPDELLHAGSVVAVVSGQRPGKLTMLLVGKKQMQRHVTSGVIGSVDGDRVPERDLLPADLARIKGYVGCAGNPARGVYCAALDRFEQGKPIAATVGGLAGISLRVDLDPAKQPVRWSEEADFLVTDASGAVYGNVKPTSDDEARQVADFIAAIKTGKPVPASHPIPSYARSLTGNRPTHPTRVLGRSTAYGANSVVYLRDTGAQLVIVETFKSDRLFYIGVFPRR